MGLYVTIVPDELWDVLAPLPTPLYSVVFHTFQWLLKLFACGLLYFLREFVLNFLVSCVSNQESFIYPGCKNNALMWVKRLHQIDVFSVFCREDLNVNTAE